MKIKRQLVRKFPARPEYSLFRKRKSLFCFGRELPINRRTCTQIDVCPDEIGTKSREFAGYESCRIRSWRQQRGL